MNAARQNLCHKDDVDQLYSLPQTAHGVQGVNFGMDYAGDSDSVLKLDKLYAGGLNNTRVQNEGIRRGRLGTLITEQGGKGRGDKCSTWNAGK